MTPLDYDYLRKCLKQRSGLVLTADKQYLVESRLLPLARKASLVNLTALVNQLKRGDEALMTAVVEAMATNESFFFRDKVPFYHFTSIIMPALIAARRSTRTIRIWCAAASTGQEPYSLAMCSEGDGERSRRLARRIARQRSFRRGAGKGAAGPLHPVRSAARPADPVFG